MQNNHVDMADVCELAHKLTERECDRRKIELEYQSKTGDVQYTEISQAIFDSYYDLITNTLKV